MRPVRRERIDPPFRFGGPTEGTVLLASLREALATLCLGLARGDPFLLLTGGAGTGKTTVVRRLLERLDAERYALGGVFGPHVQRDDLLNLVVQEFGVRRSRPGDIFLTLEQFLQRRENAAREGVLVIDEAQVLDANALRQLWQLGAPTADGQPRLHVVLVAQQLPEAVAALIRSGRAPPIGTRCNLRTLEVAEAREFVLGRVLGSDAIGRLEFTEAALQAIHERSGGVLRRLCGLCDRIGMFLASQGRHEVSAEVVATVDAQLRDEWSGSGLSPPAPPPRTGQDSASAGRPKPRAMPGTIGAALRAVPSAAPRSASQPDVPEPPPSLEPDTATAGPIPWQMQATTPPQRRLPTKLLAGALLSMAVVVVLLGLGLQRHFATPTPMPPSDLGTQGPGPREADEAVQRAEVSRPPPASPTASEAETFSPRQIAAPADAMSAPVSAPTSTGGATVCRGPAETLGLCIAAAVPAPGSAPAVGSASSPLAATSQTAECTLQRAALGLCDEP